MAYAHVLIEDPRDGTKYRPGDEVPADLPGFDELVEGGAINKKKYDPEKDRVVVPAPDVIEIDGVVYEKKASDNSEVQSDAR